MTDWEDEMEKPCHCEVGKARSARAARTPKRRGVMPDNVRRVQLSKAVGKLRDLCREEAEKSMWLPECSRQRRKVMQLADDREAAPRHLLHDLVHGYEAMDNYMGEDAFAAALVAAKKYLVGEHGD
jgi:hypothetical protein